MKCHFERHPMLAFTSPELKGKPMIIMGHLLKLLSKVKVGGGGGGESEDANCYISLSDYDRSPV